MRKKQRFSIITCGSKVLGRIFGCKRNELTGKNVTQQVYTHFFILFGRLNEVEMYQICDIHGVARNMENWLKIMGRGHLGDQDGDMRIKLK